jgi:hypothetical protein
MKLLSWSLQQGGGTRPPHIAGTTIDVIVRSEFRTKPGAMLCAQFNLLPPLSSPAPKH